MHPKPRQFPGIPQNPPWVGCMGWWGYWLLGWLVRPQLLVVTMIIIMTALKFPQSTRILPNQPEFPNLPKCYQIPHVLLIILVMRSFRLRYAFVSFWRGPRYEKKGTKGENKTISTWGYEEELIAIKMATTTTMASFFHRGQAIKCSDKFSGKGETEQMQN